MKVRFEHDQDPRYGWASIDLEEKSEGLIIVHSLEHGSLGFEFSDGDMVPTCICAAWTKDECSCPVDWGGTEDED